MPQRDQIEEVRAGFGSTLALTVAATLAAFGVLAAFLHVVVPSTALPAPFPPQHQDAETLTFVLTFVVALPLALWLVPRRSARIVKARGQDSLSGLAAGLSVLLLGLVVIVKATDRLGVAGGPYPLLAGGALWLLVAGVAVHAAGSDRGAPLLEIFAGRAREVWVAGLVLLSGGSARVRRPRFDVGRGRRPRRPRRRRRRLFVRPVVAGAAARTMGSGDRRGGDRAAPARGSESRRVRHHRRVSDADHSLSPGLLPRPGEPGAACGRAMLVDTLSQYGVASIYSLAAWFEIAPIGPGTLGFFEGVLSALVFAAAYLTIRLTGASRIIAVTAMSLAVFVLVYGLEYPLGGLLQHGAIRFGMPMIPLLAGTLELARPRYARGAQAAQLLALGVASIWALEAFAYTVLTVAAMVAVKAWLKPAGSRRRCVFRWTRGFRRGMSGGPRRVRNRDGRRRRRAPRLGPVLNTLREFLTGSIGDLTYDFLGWSPALAVGAFYWHPAATVVLTFGYAPIRPAAGARP